MLIHILRTMLLHHCLLQQLPNGARFLLVHGSLVRNTHFFQHSIRIKSFGHSLGKFVHKLLLVTAIKHIITQILSLLHILHTNIILTKTRGSNRLFMSILSMNDTRQTLLLMRIHSIPHLTHPRTGSIHHSHILLIKVLHLLQTRSKRRQNNHILIPHHLKILTTLLRLINKIHLHILQMIIHLRVMNQLIRNMDIFLRKLLHSLIRQGNATFHTPTKPKIFGQMHLHTIPFNHVLIAT
mmetsp:Transcript_18910/g.24573  ORF Transcript_18910/g.24573 Transcript_18910/m.24573 type:complete len:239 (+) Transcript_18910:509-1225(+)